MKWQRSGLEVTELCFGTLPMGPLQLGQTPEESATIIRAALQAGVNFIDTAQSYRTYAAIRQAKAAWPHRVIIASKSQVSDYHSMQQAVEEALRELDVDRVDIFHLHAPRASANVFEERAGALQCLRDCRKKGLVGAVGISTHVVQVVEKAAAHDDIDVIFPLINRTGLGIVGGNLDDMLRAIARAHEAGKDLYAMKVFGGGNLLDDREEALRFVRGIPGMQVIAIGMVTLAELEMNLKLFAGERVSSDLLARTAKASKKLKILTHQCKACGDCVEACPNGALSLVDGHSQVDETRCILCGYCAPHCPQFAIRMV